MDETASFEAPRCKVCNGAANVLGTTQNFQSPTALLHHCRCADCGLVFVGDPIDNDELAAAYGSLDQSDYYEQIRAENERKFDSALEDIKPWTDKDSRILDVGTGNGGFIERLLGQGYRQVSGQEIPDADLSAFEQRGCKIYYDLDYSTVPDESFDITTLLDVAEHVPDPHALFGACERALVPGGRVYFHTPVVTPLDRVMHRNLRLPVLGKLAQAWQHGRTSIFHLQNYTRASLQRVLEEAGFTDIDIEVKNELSWPVSGYVKVHLCQRFGLPDSMAPMLAPLFSPLLATDAVNPNKAIVSARKPQRASA